MKRHSLLAITILTLTFLFHTAKDVSGVELIANGGFETGNFSGWTATNAPSPFETWRVTGSGVGYTDSPVPTATSVVQGSFNAHQAVASNIGSFLLSQDVTIPAMNTATFTWRHRYQMNLSTYCSGAACGTATFAVEILNTSNVLLQTIYTITTPSSSNTNTGWTSNTANLSAYAGQTIRIRFRTTVTANFQGPGRLEVDGVSVNALSPVAAEVSVGGQINSANGTGIRNVAVSLTQTNGSTRTVKTNAFGYYNFEGIEVGQSVTLTVNSKRYTFANPTRIVSVSENVSDVDWTAIE